MQKTFFSVAAAALLAAVSSHADALAPLSVTASQGTALAMDATPDKVSVITRKDIERTGVRTLDEALSRLGNLPVISNGGPGQARSFLVRGFDAKRVLVLIDGVRYNDVTGLSGAQYQLIGLEDVEQIEIVKGPQSGVWGADASAGVINIVTRRAASGAHAGVTLMSGSYDTKETAANLSYAKTGFDVAASVSLKSTDGFSAAEPTATSPDYGKRGSELGLEEDSYVNRTLALRAGVNLGENDRIEASLRRIDANVEYDAGAGMDAADVDDPYGYGPSSYTNTIENRFHTLSYRHQDELHDMTLQGSLSQFKRDQYGGYEGSVSEVSLSDRIDYGEEDFVRAGGSYQKFEQSSSAGSDMDKDYSATALFVTNCNRFALFNAGATVVTESLRFDRYDDFDDKLTAKVGLKQMLGDYYVALNGGTAYNVPTLYQLHGGWVGNAELTPEETRGFEVSAGTQALSLTLFSNRVTEMIEYDFATYRYANVAGTSTLQGVEIDYAKRYFDLLELQLHYTWLDAKDADDRTLISRPQEQIDGAIFYDVNAKLSLGVDGHYVGERYDKADKEGAQTGLYSFFNASVNYRATEHLSFFGRIDNLNDRYYQVRDGYATAGRSVYVGLNATY